MSHTSTLEVPSLAVAGPVEPPDAPAPARSTALALRRAFLVATPLLAGVFLTVGAVADPAAGLSGDRMLEIYGAEPGPLQLKSLGYHWAYAFWIVPAMLIVPLVRGRGAWLATITGLIGFLGVSTMPGLLLSDWFDSAIGAAHGLDGHRAVYDHIESMWGVPVFLAPGIVATPRNPTKPEIVASHAPRPRTSGTISIAGTIQKA